MKKSFLDQDRVKEVSVVTENCNSDPFQKRRGCNFLFGYDKNEFYCAKNG